MKRFTLTIEWGDDDPPERAHPDDVSERAELDGRRPIGFSTWEDQ